MIKQNERIILKVCNVYCQEQEDRADLYQDILIGLWRSFASFNGKSKISTWIYKVALNTAISRYRKETKIPRNEPLSEELVSDVPDDENRQLLNEAIEQLNKLEKAIIMLYLDGIKYREIGDIVGLNESNVGFKINKIKGKLREKLKLDL